MRTCRLAVVVLGIASFFVTPLDAQDRPSEAVDYVRQIKPILQSRCYACHGALKREGKLRLDTVALGIQGGNNGAAIKPGDAAASLILQRVSAKDEAERMPPEGEPLTAEQIGLLKRWIAEGAKSPADEQPEQDSQSHWSFRTPVRPKVPNVSGAWVKNPIDAFLGVEHRNLALVPQPPADKRVWLRRVTLDLTGLPATPEELDAFVADQSSSAEEKIVTRLLESPRYGERWGRHWMDIWRYSDPWGLGKEYRNSQPNIWRWRDWIIESLNADKGYDQMLREMLAADELYPEDPERLRATGFLVRQYFKFNRTTWLDETIEHTSKAMLGLTFNCAKCHDHKYDPFSQVEYYRMRAIFEPYQVRTDALPGEIDFEKNGIVRAFDCNLDAVTHLHLRGDERNPDTSRVIEPGTPAFLSFIRSEIAPVRLPLIAYQPGVRPFVASAYIEQAERKVADAKRALDETRKKLAPLEEAAASAPASPPAAESPADAKPAETGEPKRPTQTPLEAARRAVTAAEAVLRAAEAQPLAIAARASADKARFADPPRPEAGELALAAARLERTAAALDAEAQAALAERDLHSAEAGKRKEIQDRLDAAKKVVESRKKAQELTDGKYTPLAGALKTLESNVEPEEHRMLPFPDTSTGRRAALARWLTDPKHPLPARVAVNHIWSRHFGRPLVATVFDFGRKGARPSHPALLDWLAVELVENGWSMKHIHRLIVTSNAYRMSSTSAGAEDNVATDPENRYYWRMNPIRMESEAIRDSLLHLAGELDFARGGAPIPVEDDTTNRRSLYFTHSHNDHQKFLEMFDDASVLDCYRRAESIVPQQALALENSPLAATMATKIRERIEKRLARKDDPQSSVSDADFIRAAFLTILATEPTADERSAAADALAQLIEAAKKAGRPDPNSAARNALVHALLNHNDFVTVR